MDRFYSSLPVEELEKKAKNSDTSKSIPQRIRAYICGALRDLVPFVQF